MRAALLGYSSYQCVAKSNMMALFNKVIVVEVVSYYSEISLRRTHHKADTLYKADKDFDPIL